MWPRPPLGHHCLGLFVLFAGWPGQLFKCELFFWDTCSPCGWHQVSAFPRVLGEIPVVSVVGSPMRWTQMSSCFRTTSLLPGPSQASLYMEMADKSGVAHWIGWWSYWRAVSTKVLLSLWLDNESLLVWKNAVCQSVCFFCLSSFRSVEDRKSSEFLNKEQGPN